MEARKPDKLHSVIPITNFDRDLALRHLKAQYLATNRDVASTGPGGVTAPAGIKNLHNLASFRLAREDKTR